MQTEKEEEHNFELRSEKVRNIIGKIPPYLIRYGTVAIGIVLLCLFIIAYYLPYKKVYSGTATISNISPNLTSDSIETMILLRFEGKLLSDVNGCPLYLINGDRIIEGKILCLSSIRDTLKRQKALCRFSPDSIEQVVFQTVDFRVVVSSKNILSFMLR